MKSERRRLDVTTRHSRLKADFLHALVLDLRQLGLVANVSRVKRSLRLRVILPRTNSTRNWLKQIQQRRLKDEQAFIARMRARAVDTAFAEGRSIDIDKIKPVIHFCVSRADKDLFKFCRLMQSVPASKLLYRQIAALVKDEGQPGAPVIGAFGLSSTIYSLGCRDRIFGWSRQDSTLAKNAGLAQCMQLSVCMAVPPYNLLRGSKLVAALAASAEVALRFQTLYGGSRVQLRAIVATVATGIHSPIFNRIMLRPGGLYRRIGETAGYFTVFFSKGTQLRARRVVVHRDGSDSSVTDRSIRTLRRALRICGVPSEKLLSMGGPKGVYLALAGGIPRGSTTFDSRYRPKYLDR